MSGSSLSCSLDVELRRLFLEADLSLLKNTEPGTLPELEPGGVSCLLSQTLFITTGV